VPSGVTHNGHLGPETEKLLNRLDHRQADQARRGIRAWLLAPTLDLYHALMRGEEIPPEQLNLSAVQRYGLRKRGAA
jgi:hypothetical protein